MLELLVAEPDEDDDDDDEESEDVLEASRFSLRLGVVLVGAVGGRLVELPLALGGPVVGVVEAGPLEVDRDGMEDARTPARRTPRRR